MASVGHTGQLFGLHTHTHQCIYTRDAPGVKVLQEANKTRAELQNFKGGGGGGGGGGEGRGDVGDGEGGTLEMGRGVIIKDAQPRVPSTKIIDSYKSHSWPTRRREG